MESQSFADGALRVGYPATVDAPSELPGQPPDVRGVDPGSPSADDPTTLIVAVLSERQFDLVRPLELVPEPAARSAGLAEPVQTASWRVDLDVDVDENAVVLLDHEGVVSWQLPAERTVRSVGGSSRSATEGATVTFTLNVNGDVLPSGGTGETRGLIPAIGRLRAYVFKFVAKALAGQAMTFLERDVQRGLVVISSHNPTRWRLVPDLSSVKLPTDRPARILLLIHGTFSSTVGSFAGLAATLDGRNFFKGAAGVYDAVIGFDHPTLSRDPMENATDLLNRLQAATVPNPPTIDIVCYSRGALVARSLVESLLPSSTWRDSSRRVVFVGGTNGGTSMTEPKNWHDFIDLYTNLAMASTRAIGLIWGSLPIAEIARGVIEGVGAFAKYLVAYAVDGGGVPGLAAMQPNGDFVRQINQTQPGQPGPGTPWFVVSSDFKPRLLGDGEVLQELPTRLLKMLIDKPVDQLFDNNANDLVVDTNSMSAVDVETGGFIADSLAFGANSRVYHLAYFIQPEVARAFTDWLVDSRRPAKVPSGSVVRAELPRSAQRDVVVVDMGARVSELREELKAQPTWVIVGNTGGSFTRRGQILSDGGSTPEIYSIDRQTVSGRIRGIPGNRGVRDALNLDALSPATTVDIGEPIPEAPMAAVDDPVGTVIVDRGAPVAVVPRSEPPPMALDVLVERPRSARRAPRGVLIDDEGATETPSTVTAYVSARMPESVQYQNAVSVVCTLSREGGPVVAGGMQGQSPDVDPTTEVIVQLVPIRCAEPVGDDRVSLMMPPPGKVETMLFSFVPSAVGTCEVWVVARQGARSLITLSLTANVEEQLAGPSRRPLVSANVQVTDERPSASLVLNIYENDTPGHVRYTYDLLNPELGLGAFGPSPGDLGDRKDYVDSIYRDIERVRINDQDDADRFLQNLQDLGSSLFTKLFPEDVQRALWDNRDKLDGLVVRSTEPYIPWELVHLKDPDENRRPDEMMFLSQFGLVRWLIAPAKELAPWPPASLRRREGRVRALCAEYKNTNTPTLPEIEQEKRFLTDELKALPVEPTYEAVKDMLNEGRFDIFHFAGHGIARDGFTQAVIQLADKEPRVGDFQEIDFSAVNVEANAELDTDGAPLVFLNACQGGRAGIQLGSLGGFANAFLCGGAGAFVSTLWSVGDNLARTFGEEFYKKLIAGETVSSAVRHARAVGAQPREGQKPDVSWLAYVVYANPHARMEQP